MTVICITFVCMYAYTPVASVCGGHTEFGDHAGQLLAVSGDVATFPEMVDLDPSLKLDVTARTEFAWSHPVSPHLAVKMEGRAVRDEELVDMMMKQLAVCTCMFYGWMYVCI